MSTVPGKKCTPLSFIRYKVVNGGSGYEAGHPPTVKVEAPPFLKDTARATAQLKQSGRVFRVALRSSGKGYEKTPEVTISPPRSVCSGRRDAELSAMIEVTV